MTSDKESLLEQLRALAVDPGPYRRVVETPEGGAAIEKIIENERERIARLPPCGPDRMPEKETR